jgi:4'-phosphopantetheinyl transferase
MTTHAAAGSTPAPARSIDCHIWSSPPLRRPSSFFGLLDSAELRRCSLFAHELDLARFVTGRTLARTALASLAGTGPESIRLHTRCPGCGGPHGKPQVVGTAAGWEFSISHSGDLVAVAITAGNPVGLDIERGEPWTGPGLPPEYELVLTARERAAVEALPEQQRAQACLTYWTRKEAVLKATGEGLNRPMTDFSLTSVAEPPAVIEWHTPGSAGPLPAMADIPFGRGYHGSVAILGGTSVRLSMHSTAAAPRISGYSPAAHLDSKQRPPAVVS